jgi:hypothetical protein
MNLKMQHKWSPAYVGVLAVVAGGILSGGFGSTTAEAAPKQKLVGREPWPGKRVVLVLPLQLGEGWNADPTAGSLLLAPAQDELHEALEATGKFSLIESHRFNPILSRAVQDKVATREQLDALVNAPTLETARQILTTMSFEQQPFIADFRLEEVRTNGTGKGSTIQVQVSGRLYEVTNPVAVKSIVVTSNPIVRAKNQSSLDTAVVAAGDAFDQIVAQFVAPLADIEFTPMPTAPTDTATSATPVPPTPVAPTPAPPSSTLPAGGLAGASSAGSPFPMPVPPVP